ncbi:hypothetical protein ACYCGX_27780, partial [Klebsiella pneumoniae]
STTLSHGAATAKPTARRLGFTLQKVIIRNLITPNKLILMSYLQNFNFAWCVGILSGEVRSEI